MRIDVLAFDGFEALDAVGPLEVLLYGGLDVALIAQDGPRLVRSAQGLAVQAEAPREDVDWLIVPGGAWSARHDEPPSEPASGVVGRVAAAHLERGGRLGVVCTGALWLADAGLLTGRPATTQHEFWDELAGYGVDVRRGERVVDDGDVVTSGGICSGLFLGLHLVERLVGPEARRAVEKEVELPAVPGHSPDTA